ncbi:MAG: relaxase/mobilization nuclease domain-containing protein [Succinivibrionaceae bacterium]|nr:relaxase/mobilization nuclease domain-containing protein [Succinivibrionaceae bacterium]
MAATCIMSIHINKGKTARQCIGDRLDYIMNPKKTDGGILVSTYACSPETAADEFMLFRQEYQANTGRTQENEVIGYHVRQAFKPDEITPEEANEIGKELASLMTNDQFAYVVATHIDKHHIHNHIIICSTDLDGQHKYRDVKQSAKDLAQISDSLCWEHSLSVIQNPQDKTVTYDKWQGNQRRFTHRDELRMIIDAVLRMQPDGFDALMQLLEDAGCRIKRGAQISIKPPEGERYIRLDTLGLEYDEASLRRTLAHDHVHIPKIPRGDYTESQIKRLIDIEAKLRAGRGKGYQVWAERNNIDAKAQMVIFLKEHHIGSLEELNVQIQELTDQRDSLKASIREKQNRMKEINRQRQAIRDYSRTKEIYTQYRESGWSVKFYQEHRQEIEDHRNAQAVYSSHDGKMPTLKELMAEYDEMKKRKDDDQAALDELKPQLTELKHIRYNYEILERDSAPNSHQHVIPKDHHFDEHAVHHDDESR